MDIDPVTLGRCFDRHAAGLVLLARQWCATPEDVVQEAFLKLSQTRTPPDNPAAWLYHVVRNAAISASRSDRRRMKREQLRQQAEWFVHDPSMQLDANQAASALQQLPTSQREVIVAHLWGGLTFEEIADVVGSSSSTCHRLFTQGLMHLRQLLGEIHAH